MTCNHKNCDCKTFTELLSDYDEHIEKYGQSIQFVSGIPPFLYTIGAAKSGIPDIFMSGRVPPQMAAITLNQLCHKLRENGVRFGLYNDLLEGRYNMALLPCNANLDILHDEFVVRNEAYFNLTSNARDLPSDMPRYAQLFVPDSNNLFPWNDGYDTRQNQEVFSSYTERDFGQANTARH